MILALVIVFGGLFLLANVLGGGGAPPSPTPPGTPELEIKVSALARGISVAEGFGVNGAIPTRANNPGDLAVGDKGLGVLGPSRVTVFASITEGWDALYRIVRGWLTGKSSIYFLDDSIFEVARKYVNGPQASANQDSEAWAANVANEIGMSTSNTLREFLGG
jgi:hypothetical protein